MRLLPHVSVSQYGRRLLVRAVVALAVVVLCLGASAAERWIGLGSQKAGAQPMRVELAASGPAPEISAGATGVFAEEVVEPDGSVSLQLSLPECGIGPATPGLPALPFRGMFLEVPSSAGVEIEILAMAYETLGTGFTVYPSQPPLPDSSDEPEPPFARDAAAYATDAFLPASPVTLGEPGIIRGRHVVFVEIYPIQYNPVTGELRACTTLRFRLRTAASKTSAPRDSLASPAFEAMAEGMLFNYQPVAAETPALTDENGAHYLILAADHLVSSILPLAEWKHWKGYRVRVVPMSQVGSTPDEVKAYLYNAYHHWNPAPTYVLLVGDREEIPPDYYSGALPCFTDHPYACPDGSDFYPDFYLGRIPVHTAEECQHVVDKILRYEQNPEAGPWLRRFIAAAYFQDDDKNAIADRWFMETSMHFRNFVRDSVGLQPITAWCTNSGAQTAYHFRSSSFTHRFARPDPVPAELVNEWIPRNDARDRITAAINEGVGIVHHRDHGGSSGWGDPPYSTTQVRTLTNGFKTPVVFSINCSTGSFWSTSDGFCEAFMKQYPGGAVGIVGSTRVSYSGPNDLISYGITTCFWPAFDTTYTNGTYPVSRRPCVGLAYGKYYMSRYNGTGSTSRGEFNMFHWFGDPEMWMRSDTPRALTVEHSGSLVVGSQSYAVTVRAEGQPVKGARVAIVLPGHPEELWAAESNTAGVATLVGVAPDGPGAYELHVSAPDGLPLSASLTMSIGGNSVVRFDRDVYGTAGVAGVELFHSYVAGQSPTVQVSSASDSESVTLTELPGLPGAFSASLPLGSAGGSDNDGTLTVMDGDTLTVTYMDLSTMIPTMRTDTAQVEGTAPVISNVRVDSLLRGSAHVAFDTDKPTRGRVLWGLAPGGPFSFTAPDPALAGVHDVVLLPLMPLTDYYFVVEAEDDLGSVARDDNGGAAYHFLSLPGVDFLTEQFSSDNDLDNTSIIFTPDGSPSGYSVCLVPAVALPVSPTGHTALALDDDANRSCSLSSGRRIPFFNETHSAFYVGSNGYITFKTGDTDGSESVSDHFALTRISALFDDLEPNTAGTVSWRQLTDRVVVTWLGVQEKGKTTTCTFQVEMFFDGTIRITYLDLSATDGLVGLSPGLGNPLDYVESDFRSYPTCSTDDLWVLRGGDHFMGRKGGPFSPSRQDFVLVNRGTSALSWIGYTDSDWVAVEPPAGEIPAGGNVTVAVAPGAAAASLPGGLYAGDVSFERVGGSPQPFPLNLTVEEPATLPFFEGFETAALRTCWRLTGTGEHRMRVMSENSPATGAGHLVMDATTGYARNELTLTLNLSEAHNVIVRYKAREFGDEPHGPPPSMPFYGGADSDGVAVSEDGVAWYEVQDMRTLTSSYTSKAINLDWVIGQYGLHYSDHFMVRFTQYDNGSVTSDGIALDDIEVVGDLVAPTPTPTATPTATDTPTDMPTATPTFTDSPTATWTATATFTDSPTPTWTATATFTDTPTPTPTWTATETATWTPTATATFTPTPTVPPLADYDLNDDGAIDALDACLVIECMAAGDLAADFDFDGDVDRMDIMLFALNYKEQPTAP